MTAVDDPSGELRPEVLFFDPITWIHDWSYDHETQELARFGVSVRIPPDRETRDQLLPRAHVVVVSSIDSLTAHHIGRLDNCVGILCYSAGMDAVDIAAANGAGIPVTNIRAGTADVADHAMTLLLAAWRRLPRMTAEADAGRWDLESHPEFRAIPRLGGRTLGIFGPGEIGHAVARRARAFDMRTIATYRDPRSATEELPHVDLGTLLAESDAVVLTASLNPSTRGVIDQQALAGAKDGLIVVNVARGGLIVEPDLAAALDSGKVAFAALDVRDPEPPDPLSDCLTGRPDVIVTTHLAGLSADALTDLHLLAASKIIRLLQDAGLVEATG